MGDLTLGVIVGIVIGAAFAPMWIQLYGMAKAGISKAVARYRTPPPGG